LILKPTPEKPEQAQLARKGSSILNRQSSKQSNIAKRSPLPILRILAESDQNTLKVGIHSFPA